MTTTNMHSQIIGSNIEAIRKARRISQRTFALNMQRYGYNWQQNTVSRVERGDRQLLAAELVLISQLLETPMSLIVTGLPNDVILDRHADLPAESRALLAV